MVRLPNRTLFRIRFRLRPQGSDADVAKMHGAAARTLRAFIGSLHDLMAVVRDFMLLNPDLAAPT